MSDPELIRRLRTTFPENRVLKDPTDLEAYRHDQATWLDGGVPAVVVKPETEVELVAAVKEAVGTGMPIVPRGAGSGLSGGCNAIDGCMVISTERMRGLRDIDEPSSFATVEPGIITADVDAAAASVGLYYPPDPASADMCTIGGNIATNAGGLCCVRQGVTRDYVLGVRLVLADGSILQTGSLARKNSAGYDMTALCVGSEGTLGIVSEAAVRLKPRPEAARTVAGLFPSMAAAGRAIQTIVRTVPVTMLEIMDRTTLDAVERWKHLELDTGSEAMLIGQVDGGPTLVELADRYEAAGASEVMVATDEMEAEVLLAARRFAYPALAREGQVILDDVCVPVGSIAELLSRIADISQSSGITIGTFGHAADGNMHPTLLLRSGDADETKRAQDAFMDILRVAIAMNGTITGEHGVGLLKREALSEQLGTHALSIQRAIKHVFDPLNIMNPGKVF